MLEFAIIWLLAINITAANMLSVILILTVTIIIFVVNLYFYRQEGKAK